MSLDISDFPTRRPDLLALWQTHIGRILAGWVGKLGVPVYRGRDVTGFAKNESGVDVDLKDGHSLRVQYLVGCDGGRNLIRKAAGIAFPGSDPTASNLIGEAECVEARHHSSAQNIMAPRRSGSIHLHPARHRARPPSPRLAPVS